MKSMDRHIRPLLSSPCSRNRDSVVKGPLDLFLLLDCIVVNDGKRSLLSGVKYKTKTLCVGTDLGE